MSKFFVILLESKCRLAVSAEKCDYKIITITLGLTDDDMKISKKNIG